MPLLYRLLTVITIVVTVTDLVAYYRLKQNLARLTLPFMLGIIFITIVPLVVILVSWHHRNWL